MISNSKGNPYHDEEGKFTSGGNKSGGKEKLTDSKRNPFKKATLPGFEGMDSLWDNMFGSAQKVIDNRSAEDKIKDMGFGPDEEETEMPMSIRREIENPEAEHGIDAYTADISSNQALKVLDMIAKKQNVVISDEDKQYIKENLSIPKRVMDSLNLDEDGLQDCLNYYLEDEIDEEDWEYIY